MKTNIRLPRPMGMTQALAQYNVSKDPELLDNIRRFFIQQWIINNQLLCGRIFTLMELSDFLKCDPELIRLQMRDQLLSTKLWDRDKQEELIQSMIGQQVSWALEDRMAVESQVQILQRSQGGKYTPFISAEVNKALSLKLQTTNNMAGILKSLQGGGSINIFNQQQNNEVSVGITMEEALQVVSSENAKIIQGKEIQYIEAHYDVEEFPEVVATKQIGIDTSKEGIQLNSGEIEKITNNYKGVLAEFHEIEEDHHDTYRERELGIDEEAIDPEV